MTDEEFDELRASAFAIAYRMLGSVSEAEDVVQEGLLRLHRAREGGERIAEIVGTGEQNARQLAARARRHVEERRPRFEASREQREALAARFFAAAEEGDLQGLEELLAHDVVLHGDGGGKAPAAARAVHGRAKVARLLIAGLRVLARFGSFTTRREQVNGQPGALVFDRAGRLLSVAILDIAEGQIQGVSAIANPDKLRHLGPVADLRALLRHRS